MILASVEAVALVAIVYLLLRHHAAQSAAWTLERRELLNRLQHPEIVPATEPVAFTFPESEPDEIELIGTIAEPKED